MYILFIGEQTLGKLIRTI